MTFTELLQSTFKPHSLIAVLRYFPGFANRLFMNLILYAGTITKEHARHRVRVRVNPSRMTFINQFILPCQKVPENRDPVIGLK